MDDTFVIQQQAHKQAFMDHINSIDSSIKFTVEGNQGNGAIHFHDTLVTPEADNSLSILCTTSPPTLTNTTIATIIYLLRIVS